MPRRPNPNPPGPDDQIRISFLLDVREGCELAFLRDLRGHGERPRELLRLAMIGLRAEAEMKEMMRTVHEANLKQLREAAVGAATAVVPAPVVPPVASQAIEPAPVGAEPPRAYVQSEPGETPTLGKTSEVNAAPATAPANEMPPASANVDVDENEKPARVAKPKTDAKAGKIANTFLA